MCFCFDKYPVPGGTVLAGSPEWAARTTGGAAPTGGLLRRVIKTPRLGSYQNSFCPAGASQPPRHLQLAPPQGEPSCPLSLPFAPSFAVCEAAPWPCCLKLQAGQRVEPPLDWRPLPRRGDRRGPAGSRAPEPLRPPTTCCSAVSCSCDSAAARALCGFSINALGALPVICC